MTRIDYDKIGFSMTEKGREIHKIAAHRDESINKSNYYAYDIHGDYAVSRKATHELLGGWYHIPGNSEYKNPALQLALAFAIKNNDKKLIKVLEKMDKYYKESYEAYFGAYHTALQFYERGDRLSESIKSKRETLEFIKKYSKYKKSDLIDLKSKKRLELSSLINSYNQNEKIKLEKEIELLDQLIQMTERKTKKMIIAKGKEIEEIIQSAKNNKSYKNRYIKYMRVANKKRKNLNGREIGEYYSIAKEIISEMSKAIKQKASGSSISEFEVDQYMLENIENELRTKYYPDSTTKTK